MALTLIKLWPHGTVIQHHMINFGCKPLQIKVQFARPISGNEGHMIDQGIKQRWNQDVRRTDCDGNDDWKTQASVFGGNYQAMYV